MSAGASKSQGAWTSFVISILVHLTLFVVLLNIDWQRPKRPYRLRVDVVAAPKPDQGHTATPAPTPVPDKGKRSEIKKPPDPKEVKTPSTPPPTPPPVDPPIDKPDKPPVGPPERDKPGGANNAGRPGNAAGPGHRNVPDIGPLPDTGPGMPVGPPIRGNGQGGNGGNPGSSGPVGPPERNGGKGDRDGSTKPAGPGERPDQAQTPTPTPEPELYEGMDISGAMAVMKMDGVSKIIVTVDQKYTLVLTSDLVIAPTPTSRDTVRQILIKVRRQDYVTVR